MIEAYAILYAARMVYDFHTHTLLSDGVLSPLELVRRAHINDYRAVAITDHAGIGYLERLIAEITADCALAQEHWPITAIPGVELTHLPAAAIAQVAKTAKEMGAKLVVVHGETTAEPVEPGTNLAAVTSPYVNILAHPGQITLEEARLAAANGIYLEITARKAHSSTNKHVAQVARKAGAKLLINSDAHDEQDLLFSEQAYSIAQKAGLSDDEIAEALYKNPLTLVNTLLADRSL
ncbi:MAG: histidinol phosphate phosphatase domain-containing protein [Chloroflexota bacterium]|nr:histidinol phosphate phosphatase domain-containing protein [Chloroflexota bacterium]